MTDCPPIPASQWEQHRQAVMAQLSAFYTRMIPPNRQSIKAQSKPCIVNGQRFESTHDAATQLDIPQHVISCCCQRGKGWKWFRPRNQGKLAKIYARYCT